MVFRDNKGAPLTAPELDANFRRLQGTANNVDLRDFNGYDATGLNDSTSVIQTALNQLVAAGGGVLHVPYISNTYKIAGPLITSIAGSETNPNCQLYLPLVTIDQAIASGKMMTVEIRGSSITNGSTEGIAPLPRNSQGVIFESTIQGTGALPSVLGTPAKNAGVTQTRNYLHVHLQNLFVRTNTTNSSGQSVVGTMSAINFGDLIQFTLDEVKVDVTSGLQQILEPTNGTCGIIFPKRLNKVILGGGGNAAAEGYTNGIVLSEHANLGHVQVYACKNGIVVPDGDHMATIRHLTAELNNNPILQSGDMHLRVGTYEVEQYLDANAWFQHQYDVAYQAGGRGRGLISIDHAHIVKSGGGPYNHFVKDPNAKVLILAGHGANATDRDGGPDAVMVHDEDARISYTGATQVFTGIRYLGQREIVFTSGGTASFAGTFTNIDVKAVRGQSTTDGFSVYIDNTLHGTGNATGLNNFEETETVYRVRNLPQGQHTIKVVFNGLANFDGFLYS